MTIMPEGEITNSVISNNIFRITVPRDAVVWIGDKMVEGKHSVEKMEFDHDEV